jgi:hypothetical protein
VSDPDYPFSWVPTGPEFAGLGAAYRIGYAALQEEGDGFRPVFRPFTIADADARLRGGRVTSRSRSTFDVLQVLEDFGLAVPLADGRWRLVTPWEDE